MSLHPVLADPEGSKKPEAPPTASEEHHAALPSARGVSRELRQRSGPRPLPSADSLPLEAPAIAPEAPPPAPGSEGSKAEAAKAVAAARSAAAQRLREAAAKAAASRSSTPAKPAGSPTPSGSAKKRRAPADLVELPSKVGEVKVTARPPRNLTSPQVVVQTSALSLPSQVSGGPTQLLPEISLPPPADPPAAASAGSLPPSARSGGPTQPLAEVIQPARPPATAEETVRRLRLDPEGHRRTELVEVIPVAPVEPPRRPLLYAMVGLLLGATVLILFRLATGPRTLVGAPDRTALSAAAAGGAELAALLGRIDRSLDVEDWNAALTLSSEALKIRPDHAGLAERRRRAESELRNHFRYDGFRRAAAKSNAEAALALYAELPEDSLYRGKARPEADRLREGYVAARLTEARAARRAGLCPQVQRLTQAVLAVDESNQEARALVERCAGEREPHRGGTPGRRPKASPPASPPPPGQKSNLRDPFAT